MKIKPAKCNAKKIMISNRAFMKHTYTVSEIQTILNISRTLSYQLVNSGVFPVIKIGKTIRIPVKTFNEWMHKGCIAS